VETFREQISSEVSGSSVLWFPRNGSLSSQRSPLQAEHLVASFFPKKLLELDQFLKVRTEGSNGVPMTSVLVVGATPGGEDVRCHNEL